MIDGGLWTRYRARLSIISLPLLWVGLTLATPSLHVSSSSVAAEFERALRLERPGLELSAEHEAEVTARLEHDEDRFELVLFDRESASARLMRSIPISGDPEAALRVAVLLTLSALDGEQASVRTSTPSDAPSPRVRPAPSAEPSSSSFSIHLVTGAGFWVDQPAPQLSMSAAFLGRWSRLRAGVQASTYGLFCCDRRNEVIQASWTELSVGGLVGLTALDAGDLRLAVDVGAGLLMTLGRAVPAPGVFASPGLEEPFERLGLEFSATVELEARLSDQLAFVTRGGLRLMPLRSSLELPLPFQGLGEPLVSAWGTPFLQLGLRVFFF